jgi:hypothetical protein
MKDDKTNLAAYFETVMLYDVIGGEWNWPRILSSDGLWH